jgi:hypothetical protein
MVRRDHDTHYSEDCCRRASNTERCACGAGAGIQPDAAREGGMKGRAGETGANATPVRRHRNALTPVRHRAPYAPDRERLDLSVSGLGPQCLHQSATSEILSVVATSSGELEPAWQHHPALPTEWQAVHAGQRITGHQQGVGSLTRKRCEGYVDVAARAGIQDLDSQPHLAPGGLRFFHCCTIEQVRAGHQRANSPHARPRDAPRYRRRGDRIRLLFCCGA